MKTSMPGQEGVPSVFSPMARTLGDLVYFAQSFVSVKPWLWDHSVHPLEWRTETEETWRSKKRYKIGVIRTDGEIVFRLDRNQGIIILTLTKGVVDPSPACARALQRTVSALDSEGHMVRDVTPPSPFAALKIASRLLTSDGCHSFMSLFRTGETNDPGARQMNLYMRLPRPIKYLHYLWTRYVRRDPLWAELLHDWHPMTAHEQWQWVSRREAYKALWHDWWNSQDLDFLVAPVNATPAAPHGGMKEAVSNCGYTFLFNLVWSPKKIPLLMILGG